MDSVEKKLAPGEQRFVPKKMDRSWYVYDRARASYPAITPGFGPVMSAMKTEEEAQEECDRLKNFYETR